MHSPSLTPLPLSPPHRSDAEVDGEPPAKQRRLGGGADDTDFSMASLARGVVKEVGTLDPVKDYVTLLGMGEDVEVGEWLRAPQLVVLPLPILITISTSIPVSKQLQKVILKLIKESFGEMYYPKALDCLVALRQQAVKVGCVACYTIFVLCHTPLLPAPPPALTPSGVQRVPPLLEGGGDWNTLLSLLGAGHSTLRHPHHSC